MKKTVKTVKKVKKVEPLQVIPIMDDEFCGNIETDWCKECGEAKDIIKYLLSKLEGETGKGIDRARLFLTK